MAPLEEWCHNSEKAHFELRPQEVCLGPYLPSGIASQVYFLKWPREERSVVILLMRLQSPSQWVFPLSRKVVFFELWQCSPGGAVCSAELTKNTVLVEIFVRLSCHRWRTQVFFLGAGGDLHHEFLLGGFNKYS
jgi:hypothetical protein